jgi:hypothetical protein
MTSGIKDSARHGTMPGYNKHLRHGEQPCGACRAHRQDWGRARRLRIQSGYRLSMSEALAELGLPADRVPGEVKS